MDQRKAIHLRIGPDPRRSTARTGVDPGPAGDQPLRDDRGSRHHQPAARWALAARVGRAAARRRRVRVLIDGNTLASPGEAGSVQLRGPNLFHEYWRRPDATREAFASGWFDTGDLGKRDAAGFLTLVGRKNDLIITNGFNVYPQVVERAINECPGVRESAVLGVPDTRRGERVVAAVVRADEALSEQRAPGLPRRAAGRLPAAGEIVFVADLPRNAMGKVLAGANFEGSTSPADQPRAETDRLSLMIEPGLALAGGPRGGDRAELHDGGQSGVPFAGAGLGDRDLPGAGFGAAIHDRRGAGGFPDRSCSSRWSE